MEACFKKNPLKLSMTFENKLKDPPEKQYIRIVNLSNTPLDNKNSSQEIVKEPYMNFHTNQRSQHFYSHSIQEKLHPKKIFIKLDEYRNTKSLRHIDQSKKKGGDFVKPLKLTTMNLNNSNKKKNKTLIVDDNMLLLKADKVDFRNLENFNVKNVESEYDNTFSVKNLDLNDKTGQRNLYLDNFSLNLTQEYNNSPKKNSSSNAKVNSLQEDNSDQELILIEENQSLDNYILVQQPLQLENISELDEDNVSELEVGKTDPRTEKLENHHLCKISMNRSIIGKDKENQIDSNFSLFLNEEKNILEDLKEKKRMNRNKAKENNELENNDKSEYDKDKSKDNYESEDNHKLEDNDKSEDDNDESEEKDESKDIDKSEDNHKLEDNQKSEDDKDESEDEKVESEDDKDESEDDKDESEDDKDESEDETVESEDESENNKDESEGLSEEFVKKNYNKSEDQIDNSEGNSKKSKKKDSNELVNNNYVISEDENILNKANNINSEYNRNDINIYDFEEELNDENNESEKNGHNFSEEKQENELTINKEYTYTDDEVNFDCELSNNRVNREAIKNQNFSTLENENFEKTQLIDVSENYSLLLRESKKKSKNEVSSKNDFVFADNEFKDKYIEEEKNQADSKLLEKSFKSIKITKPLKKITKENCMNSIEVSNSNPNYFNQIMSDPGSRINDNFDFSTCKKEENSITNQIALSQNISNQFLPSGSNINSYINISENDTNKDERIENKANMMNTSNFEKKAVLETKMDGDQSNSFKLNGIEAVVQNGQIENHSKIFLNKNKIYYQNQMHLNNVYLENYKNFIVTDSYSQQSKKYNFEFSENNQNDTSNFKNFDSNVNENLNSKSCNEDLYHYQAFQNINDIYQLGGENQSSIKNEISLNLSQKIFNPPHLINYSENNHLKNEDNWTHPLNLEDIKSTHFNNNNQQSNGNYKKQNFFNEEKSENEIDFQSVVKDSTKNIKNLYKNSSLQEDILVQVNPNPNYTNFHKKGKLTVESFQSPEELSSAYFNKVLKINSEAFQRDNDFFSVNKINLNNFTPMINEKDLSHIMELKSSNEDNFFETNLNRDYEKELIEQTNEKESNRKTLKEHISEYCSEEFKSFPKSDHNEVNKLFLELNKKIDFLNKLSLDINSNNKTDLERYQTTYINEEYLKKQQREMEILFNLLFQKVSKNNNKKLKLQLV